MDGIERKALVKNKSILSKFYSLRFLKRKLTSVLKKAKPNKYLYNEIFDKHGFIFIHVPKTGGLSVLQSILNQDFRVGHKRAIQFLKHDQKRFESYFKFAFVRNPYDRFVSAYSYLYKGGAGYEDEDFARRHIRPYKDFETFTYSLENPKFVKKILRWRHFKPQHHFLCDNSNKLLIDFVGKYETMARDYEHIRNKLGFGNDLKHVNSSGKRDFRQFYNKRTQSIIKDLYKEDFNIFDYKIDL